MKNETTLEPPESATQTIQIELVESSKALKQFIDFPHDLYAGDPNYVPELFMAQEALLNRKKSPFFQHSAAAYFLARSAEGEILGRIAAINNRNYNAFTGENAGFFGFFDVINDYSVAKTLLDTAVDWLRQQGLDRVLGPTNLSTNETCGLLIEHFDEPPFVLTTYNFPYYAELLEQYGFVKNTDLLSYEFFPENLTSKLKDLSQQLENRLAQRGITIRTIDMKHFEEEVNRFLPIYNASWDQNLGFVPMTEAEVRQMGKDLKMALDPDLVYFAEKDGKTIGIALTVPNLNEVFIKIPRGRLFPTGLFKFLFGKKAIKTLRVVALGILPEYRRSGLDVCFYVRTYEAAQRKGIQRAEASWILENNDLMNRALLQIQGKVYRKHRIYEKAL
jgi:GNAT superfamily N-acetyltransferase